MDPNEAGVSEQVWRDAIAHCHELTVERTVAETHDSVSVVLAIPEALREPFAYQAGQFLSFKIPHEGRVLTRSYSLASSPDTESEHKVTVKRVDDGRISNWMNDAVRAGSKLQVVPPAGHFVLRPGETRELLIFAGGSGITPCISIIKTLLATTQRRAKLVYANRDERSIIFRAELDALVAAHPDRLEVVHSLDDRDGFLTASQIGGHAEGDLTRDFYLCGPTAFMDVIEGALMDRGVPRDRVHIERFFSPPDHDEDEPLAPAAEGEETAPASITIVLDGSQHEVPYEQGERVLAAARRAGLDPPFSCEEGYCSCCMAKLASGEVKMATNDCLTPDLLEEGWVLTCQSRCVSPGVRIEYPD